MRLPTNLDIPTVPETSKSKIARSNIILILNRMSTYEDTLSSLSTGGTILSMELERSIGLGGARRNFSICSSLSIEIGALRFDFFFPLKKNWEYQMIKKVLKFIQWFHIETSQNTLQVMYLKYEQNPCYLLGEILFHKWSWWFWYFIKFNWYIACAILPRVIVNNCHVSLTSVASNI